MDKLNNIDFAAFVRKMVRQPYWYGTVLYRCTDSLLARKSKQYPGHYTSSRMARYRDDIAHQRVAADCVGDVRQYQGAPYKCVQAHDATGNPDWTPDAVPALWMQYHGSIAETARAWVAPTGAHDMYHAGEYMAYTDGKVYRCLSDTAYRPGDYAAAWEAAM